MKKGMMIALSLMLCLLAGCSRTKQYAIGDFMVQNWNDNTYFICGLSEQGKTKEVLVIPTEINGKKVAELAENLGMARGGSFVSENLKKVYYTKNIATEFGMFSSCKILEYVILNYFTDNNYLSDMGLPGNSKYLLKKEIAFGIYSNNSACKAANVSYYYNYNNAPNEGYYWLDNYEYGEAITFIPEDPTRENYIFGGWYKEPECVTQWKYEEDVLPEAKLDEDGKTVYQETALYAKWMK